MPSLVAIGQQIKEKQRGHNSGILFLTPSVDPTVLVDLFWFVQKCRLLHMLKQGRIMT